MEKILYLIEKLKESKEFDLLKLIRDTLAEMDDYVCVVNEMERIINILRFRMDPEEYRIKIQELDTKRRITHNSVISGIKMMNRICRKINIPIVYDGDESDRYAIADFAGTISKEFFAKRKR